MKQLKESHSHNWPIGERFSGGDALKIIQEFSEKEMRRLVEENGYTFILGHHYPTPEQIERARQERENSAKP